LYLLENSQITIVSGREKITKEQLLDIALRLIPRFRELYTVYKDLRERGFVVRRGLKFGVDYLVYKFGPGIDHAPYGVQVYGKNERIDPIDIVRMGRLLHSVKKKLIIAVVGKDTIDYMLYSWWKP